VDPGFPQNFITVFQTKKKPFKGPGGGFAGLWQMPFSGFTGGERGSLFSEKGVFIKKQGAKKNPPKPPRGGKKIRGFCRGFLGGGKKTVLVFFFFSCQKVGFSCGGN